MTTLQSHYALAMMQTGRSTAFMVKLQSKNIKHIRSCLSSLASVLNNSLCKQHQHLLTPEAVSREVACLVHSEEYVDKFFNGHTTSQEQRVTGIPWSPGLVSRVRYETGGTVLAARAALQRGLACSTAGGTHHAFPGHGSGYCFLNDLAVAARLLGAGDNPRRVLIVDLDVHQGDGTAAIFAGDERVFTFSVHCEKNFPLRKQRSDLDVGLDMHTADVAYMAALRNHMAALLDLFRPDLVLYDAGVDPHVNDVLGKLDLSDQGLFDRDYFVMSETVRRGIPCATVIGGGYSRDLSELARRHTIVHRAATRVYQERLGS
ncbi:uncharacterized protein SYNPCC7002_A1628-like isoform X2 [Amphibalanus amphitrite]|uniref:uncharacterized protein SYNPCC7002_A1628-like isoform X2 n=1 Tax=Amphibalanus amphitrite TaxID=1232801 RepID=UPI001C90D7C3|nr:uncharacterized protein SYNPCC7002_A1628-like isoform X2 [Amphibalanus amphitrite]